MKLTKPQKELYGDTHFGQLLRLPECQYQGQILHHILLRELKQPNLEELWFFVAHKPRRFGIAKFSLITSLNCFGDLDKTRFKLGDDGFKEKYFNYYLKITKAILESVFIQSNFMNDQDAVNMVVLYLNNNYLFFFKDYGKLVEDVDIKIFASGSFDEYP